MAKNDQRRRIPKCTAMAPGGSTGGSLGSSVVSLLQSMVVMLLKDMQSVMFVTLSRSGVMSPGSVTIVVMVKAVDINASLMKVVIVVVFAAGRLLETQYWRI